MDPQAPSRDAHQPDRWHEFYGDRPAWVFTHRELPLIPGIDIRFVQGPVRAAYDEMVAAVGAGAPLLPRRITPSRLSFREGGLVCQRLNVVLDVKKKDP